MEKKSDLVIIGAGDFAQIAYEYFTHDSGYRVVGFAVETSFLSQTELFGLPVVPFEEIETHFPPSSTSAFVAIVFNQLNRVRVRLVDATVARGYALASYISSHAFVWRNVSMGEHCFVFENNVIQPFVRIGRNVILWSGNHVGHHSRIGNNVFISSHVVISGSCEIGDNCFLGVNAAIGNGTKIAQDCWLSPGTTIIKNTAEAELIKAPVAEIAKVDARRYFKVQTDA